MLGGIEKGSCVRCQAGYSGVTVPPFQGAARRTSTVPSPSIAPKSSGPSSRVLGGLVRRWPRSGRTHRDGSARATAWPGWVLRLLQLIQGSGNWNAQTISRELDCSERTVYRDLQTLSAAGIPWYFDDFSQSYKLREGYRVRFPRPPPKHAPEQDARQGPPSTDDARSIATLAREAAQRLLVEAEGVVQALDRLTRAIEDISGPRSS